MNTFYDKGLCEGPENPGPWSSDEYTLKPFIGDLIEFQRNGYCHWGIYMGDGEIAHFNASDGEITSHEYVEGNITISSLVEIIGNSKARTNSKSRLHFTPMGFNSIKNNLEILMENSKSKLQYQFLRFNCEHFATFLKFGIAFSEQEDKVGILLNTIFESDKIGAYLDAIISNVRQKLKERKAQQQWEENLRAADEGEGREPKFLMGGNIFIENLPTETPIHGISFSDVIPLPAVATALPAIGIRFPNIGGSLPLHLHAKNALEPPNNDQSQRSGNRSISTNPNRGDTFAPPPSGSDFPF